MNAKLQKDDLMSVCVVLQNLWIDRSARRNFSDILRILQIVDTLKHIELQKQPIVQKCSKGNLLANLA